jgi:hypothetical protein
MLKRLEDKFPTATVKHGWAETYFEHNDHWPLVTIAPATSDQRYDGSGTAGQNNTTWTVYIIDKVERTETEISKRLIQFVNSARLALLARPASARHNTYGGLLSQGPTEPTPAKFVQPDKGLPYAGLVLTITTQHAEKLE